MLTVGSLFSGIGGLDLGLERAGMRVVWQSEIDPYASRVLKKHWSDVPNLGDITKIQEFPYVDLICGGFPCQDISNAGKRAGIEGSRSGLWSKMLRCVRMVRPRYVIVENSSALLARGMDRVLGDLAEIGCNAEWQSIPACAVGAPHIRDRVFIVAKPNSERRNGQQWSKSVFTNADHKGQSRVSINGEEWDWLPECTGEAWSLPEPRMERMVNGVPNRMDRVRVTGNAVVPQVAEWIGRRIMEAEQRRTNETQRPTQ